MKVAVTAEDKSLDSPVDQRFGRAKLFLVVDTDSGMFTVQDNLQNLNAVQGAGIQAAKNVIDIGVSAVISGHIGPKAFSALQASEIKIYTGAQGSVREAIEDLKNGKLQSQDQADVEGRWM